MPKSLPRTLVLAAALALALGLPAIAQQPTKPTEPVPPKTIEPTPKTPKTPKPPAKKPAEATLKVGSKAPAIKADKWIKGEEVNSFEPGKVYVLDFWATWCRPCSETIPHLSKKAREHKNLTVIGMASSERKGRSNSEGDDNRLSVLEKFVADQGDKMNYTVAYDGVRAMSKDWLDTSTRDQTYLPKAFVINHEGVISHIAEYPYGKSFDAAVEKALKAAPASSTPTSDPKPAPESPKPAPAKPKSKS